MRFQRLASNFAAPPQSQDLLLRTPPRANIELPTEADLVELCPTEPGRRDGSEPEKMDGNGNDLANIYCLSGELDGGYASFPLASGRHLVGHARSADIRLQVRGVSRRHAAIRVAPEGSPVIQDLGSKNGTLVNGRPISGSVTLGIGDEVRFGAGRFVIGRIDSEDAELAVQLVGGEDSTTAELSVLETTLLSRVAPTAEGLEWITEFWSHLTPDRNGDLGAALGFLVRAADAASGAWVEWARFGDGPTVLAAQGEIGSLPAEPALRRGSPGSGDVATLGDEARTAVALRTDIGDVFAIVLWQIGVPRASFEAPLVLATRLAERFRPEALAPRAEKSSETEPVDDGLRFPEGILVGQAPAMRALYAQMRPLTRVDLPVLICGETGVGKEHLALTLHRSSQRAARSFVAINCAAIPAELLEAELFGIASGVATGVKARPGKFLEADGGTLFLDEIGDMSPELQAKLLRALQNREIQPLGTAAQPVDVRVVAATNTDLLERIEEGAFRQDLYYRLAGSVLEVPALRQRIEDLPLLVAHFLRRSAVESGRAVRGLTVKALRLLSRHSWPGNVRELEHEIRRLVHVCAEGRAVDSSLLSPHIGRRADTPMGEEKIDFESRSLEDFLEVTERRVVSAALKETGGNQTQAAKLLGVSRNGLAKRLERLAIDTRDFSEPG